MPTNLETSLRHLIAEVRQRTRELRTGKAARPTYEARFASFVMWKRYERVVEEAQGSREPRDLWDALHEAFAELRDVLEDKLHPSRKTPPKRWLA